MNLRKIYFLSLCLTIFVVFKKFSESFLWLTQAGLFFYVGPSVLNTENLSVRLSFSETSQPIRFERVVRNRCDVGRSENKREVSV